MKKKISLILTVVMIITSFNITGTNASEDLAKHWAGDVLLKWQQENYLKGDENGKVHPDAPLSRAEFVALLNRAMGNTTMEGKELPVVSDLKANDWYYNDMMIALEKGYIKLSAETTVMPNNTISRQEIMTIMSRLINKPASFDLAKIKDHELIADWAKDSVQNMVGGGYIVGYDGKINPRANTTKAEAVVLINSYKENDRKLYFQGEYQLGDIHQLTVLSENIKVKNTNMKELVIGKDVKGKVEVENSKVGEIKNYSKAVELYVNGVKTETEAIKETTSLYKDGEYEGKAYGYKSDIKVKVTVKDGKIAKIDIVDEKEDARYFKAAKSVINRILDKQDTQVDASSGATLSSKGIMYAVEDALSKALVKKEIIATEYKDGEYYGEGAGYSGTIRVKVKVENSQIKDIEVVSHSDDYSYMRSAQNILSDVKKKQSAKVDIISGATYSSEGLMNAVEDALSQALGKTDAPGKSKFAKENKGRDLSSSNSGATSSVIEQSFSDLIDGVYTGSASGYHTNSIEVEVTVKNKKIDSIRILRNNDDKDYYGNGIDPLLSRIINEQGTKVDNISGATSTSKGIKNAIVDALKDAGFVTKISSDFNGLNKDAMDVEVISSNLTAKNLRVKNNLTITAAVGDGDLILENIHVKGDLEICGGGNSIYLKNTTVEGNVIINKESGENVQVIFDKGSKVGKEVKVMKPAIIKTSGAVEINRMRIDLNVGKNRKIEIEANLKELDVQTDDADILVKAGSKIDLLKLPKNADKYSKSKKEYTNATGSFKLVIEDGAIINQGLNKEKENTSQLNDDELEIRKKSDETLEEILKLKSEEGFSGGKYTVRTKGFDTVHHIETLININEAGDRIDSAEIPVFGDSAGFGGHAIKLLQFVSGKPINEVIDNISIVLLHRKYLNQIDNVKDKQARYEMAKNLIGENCAEEVNKAPEDATQRLKFISGAVTKYIIGEYNNKKEVMDAVSGATVSAGGIAQGINDALVLSKNDKKGVTDVVGMSFVGQFNENPYKDTAGCRIFAKPNQPLTAALNYKDLIVQLDKKEGDPVQVKASEFESNNIQIINTDTNEQINPENDLTIDIPKIQKVIKAKVVHTLSKRELEFRIIVNSKYSDNYIVGLEYKVDGDWTEVSNPVYFAKSFPGNPYQIFNINNEQEVNITKAQSEQYAGKKVYLRVVLKQEESSLEGSIANGKYIELGSVDFEPNEQLKYNPQQRDWDYSDYLNWNYHTPYKITFHVDEDESE